MPNILHISDLHRDASHPLSNSALIDSLDRDRERYQSQYATLETVDLILVSGDIVLGVAATTQDAGTQLELQYQEAESFLSALADIFVAGNRDRVVIVPGNHDVNFYEVTASLKEITFVGDNAAAVGVIAEHVNRLNAPDSMLRWSWKTLSFSEVVDKERYLRRFQAFADFYQSFYGGSREYSVQPDRQYDLFDYPDLGITIVGLNSCYNNDPLNRVASIHPDCIAAAARELRDGRYRGRLRIALWHHSTNGPPGQIDHLDPDFLQVLADCGISLGLHGHQHRPQLIDERYQFGEDRKITVISAGTLCGGPGALPTGHSRSYNLIEVDLTNLSGTTHIRQMKNDSFDSPIWGPGAVPSNMQSFINFKIQPPSNVGNNSTPVMLAEAEEKLSTGAPEEAVKILKPLLATSDLARRLLLEALVVSGSPSEIVEHFNPPRSPSEFVFLADAMWEMGDVKQLQALITGQEISGSTDPAIVETVSKYSARMTDLK